MAAPPGAAPRLYYVPKPHEMPYYDGLFAVADTQRAGSIGGAEAVRFFQTSGLPVEALKTVWTVADQPASNHLDKRKFAVAVRLIQLLQNNAKGEGASLAAPEGVVLKPVHFEGISGVRVPVPPPDSAGPGPGAGAGPPQQPPPPQQQQQQYQYQQSQAQAPMTPPRPPMHPPAPSMGGGASVGGGGGGGGPMTSTALTTQDPFVMTPAERQRYEALFPQYAKDGYVYGAQAVELFSKSGAPQAHLAAIWNMVDVGPVDNRLDPLEFAMAMHLIVCVSKKNLPLPPSLPYSLKLLKEQQQHQQQQQQPPSMVVPQQHPHQPSFSQPGSPVSAARAAPTPPPTMMMQQHQHQQPPPQYSYQQPPPPPAQAAATMGIPRVQTPYHHQQQPAANSIPSPGPHGSGGIPEPAPSSAFSSLPAPPPLSQQAGGLSISDAFEGLSGGGGGMASPSYAAPASSFGGYAGDASVSSAQDEIFHIPDPPAPAPAANSAPAPAPAARSFPAEAPKTSQQIKDSYNLGEASEELTKLRAILQKLQAENISLKATMGSLTEEEKDVQKELHGVVAEISKLSNELTSLRAKVLAAKSRLLEATAELKANNEKKGVLTDLISEARATKDALDDAYHGVEKLNEAARAAPAPAPAVNYDSDLFGFDVSSAPIPQQQQQQQQQKPATSYEATSSPPPAPQVSNDKSFDDDHRNNQDNALSFGSDANSSSVKQNIHRSNAYQSYDSSAAGYGLGTTSSGYMEGEGIMGGAPTPLPTEPSYGSAGYGNGAVPTAAEIADLKKKLKEAQDVAREAEESKRQVVAHADELRRIADEAEDTARKYQNQPESMKKKGLFGKKKPIEKDPKEVERLALEAKAKKDELMKVQSQINDAQKLASDTKAEEERLRKTIEDMELQAASAASLQQKQPTPQNGGYSPAIQPNQSHDSNDYGGFGGPMGMGGTQFKATPAPAPAPVAPLGGFGGGPSQPSDAGGYNPNVMGGGGGGGFSIPEPTSTGYDPYMNPFGE